ncbi:MAG: coenzyme A pyrophosphatase [Aequorivita sp.]|nr:coenzyme A pyrophosphatase [Aequorivita sp.]|tara:strand:- start:64277 stop:64918 length:642 start_codon:yes stop_codon:yes gene_type:complete
MNFHDFEKRIVKVTKMELPGETVQYRMAPMERLQELKRVAKHQNTAKRAGVMSLFYPSENLETHLILILRKSYKGVHSAQVGFPGGKVEKEDNNMQDTALRETEEEVGVPREKIAVLKELTEIYIPPSNYFVQPYLGITSKMPKFIPQEDEVEALIEVNLKDFLNDNSITSQIITTSYATNLKVPAFKLNGHIVWGATAMMLNEVRELLEKVL